MKKSLLLLAVLAALLVGCQRNEAPANSSSPAATPETTEQTTPAAGDTAKTGEADAATSGAATQTADTATTS